MPVNVQKAVERFKEQMIAKQDKMREGIDGVTQSPGVKAAENVQGYADGCARAAANGKFVSGCQSYTAQEWKDAAKSKGVANMATGVRNMSAKSIRKMQEAITETEQVAQEVRNMPGRTLAERLARMEAQARTRAARAGNVM
jgi:hypothetical protein